MKRVWSTFILATRRKLSNVPNVRDLALAPSPCSTVSVCSLGNWHYKYQETLEIHMKEKHQVNSTLDGQQTSSMDVDNPCAYCLSHSVHPRLARGEQYPCGFKPYRCELCLYSTTTKGNLAIHMQSDKHMNNCKDLSSTSIQQLCTSLASPDNSTSDATNLCQGMFSCFPLLFSSTNRTES